MKKIKDLHRGWKKGLEKSRALRMMRRAVLFSAGVALATLILKLSPKRDV